MKPNDIPVGATWAATNRHYNIRVWLKERRGSFDIWMYTVEYKDGSGLESDWATSYRSAANSAKLAAALGGPFRLKRVWDKENQNGQAK